MAPNNRINRIMNINEYTEYVENELEQDITVQEDEFVIDKIRPAIIELNTLWRKSNECDFIRYNQVCYEFDYEIDNKVKEYIENCFRPIDGYITKHYLENEYKRTLKDLYEKIFELICDNKDVNDLDDDDENYYYSKIYDKLNHLNHLIYNEYLD